MGREGTGGRFQRRNGWPTQAQNGAAPQHLAESRDSAGWYQPRQNASSQVLLSRMAEMIKPTIE
jgi:hypothetical protein